MSCHVMSCHVMSCHVMSCHVMSCHVMSCHVMSCHLTLPLPFTRDGKECGHSPAGQIEACSRAADDRILCDWTHVPGFRLVKRASSPLSLSHSLALFQLVGCCKVPDLQFALANPDVRVGKTGRTAQCADSDHLWLAQPCEL